MLKHGSRTVTKLYNGSNVVNKLVHAGRTVFQTAPVATGYAQTNGHMGTLDEAIDLAATNADFVIEFEFSNPGSIYAYILRSSSVNFYLRNFSANGFRVGWGGSIIDATGATATTNDGQWHHIKYERISGDVNAYIDQELVLNGYAFNRSQTGITGLGNGDANTKIRNLKINNTYIYPLYPDGRDTGLLGNDLTIDASVFIAD